MREYLTEIKLVCDSLAGCGHPIEKMQQINIILNGVKGQFDNVISVIHVSRNPIASISSVLLDDEAQQKEFSFDTSFPRINVAVKPTPEMPSRNSANSTTDSRQIQPSDTAQQTQLTHEYQANNGGYSCGRGRGRGNNKPQC